MGKIEWSIRKISRNITMIRIIDSETRFFEALWEIPEMISYNSYFISTEEGGILIDTGPRDSYAFLEALDSVASPKDVSFLVVNHMEPDHSGALELLIERNRDIKIVSHPISFHLMKSFYGISPSSRLEIKDGGTLKVGKDELRFFHLPWLHWPETIVTYLESRRALFTGDVFGAYSIESELLESEEIVRNEKYLWEMKKYFVNVIGAYRNNVLSAVRKLRELNLNAEIVLPAHGAVFHGNGALESLLSIYEGWSRCGEKREAIIALSSMYGFSEEVAKEVSEALEQFGVPSKIFRFTSKMRNNFSDAIAAMQDASLIVIISSTYENSPHPIIEYLVSLMGKKLCREKKILLIGTYGWGGGIAASILFENLVKKGFNVLEPITVNSKLTSWDKEKIHEVVAKLFLSS
ncbi:MAG: FprA family A-type flavoprotein [Fervidicoccaceae archaeon]